MILASIYDNSAESEAVSSANADLLLASMAIARMNSSCPLPLTARTTLLRSCICSSSKLFVSSSFILDN